MPARVGECVVMAQAGPHVWQCWQCGELLMAWTPGGYVWVNFYAERLPDKHGNTRLTCPSCRRVNARRTPDLLDKSKNLCYSLDR